MDGAGIAHLSCNRSHGGRIGSARAQKNLAQKKVSRSNARARAERSLEGTTEPPPWPLQELSPSPQGETRSAVVEPVRHPEGFVLPRLQTATHPRRCGTWGPDARTWIANVYGMQLRGWQAYALDRALEVDDSGALLWSKVIITVGRQSGKSWLARGLCMWRLHHAHLFGEEQTVLHVANKRETAMEVMRPAGLWATEQYGKQAAKWGNTLAGIVLPTGDRWLIHAANESAGVGYSVSMVFVDEAWKVKREVIDSSIAPTMAERLNPQMYLVSTSGDASSDLMLSYRARGLDSLTEPNDVLLLEWSAPPDAPIDQVETWMYGSPQWSDAREKFVRQQFMAVEPSAFKRQYLNQWVIRHDHWLKDGLWDAALESAEAMPDGHWCVAAESDFDGMANAVAVAAVDTEGLIHVRVTTHRTIRDVDDKLAQLRAQHPDQSVMVTPAYLERLTSHTDGVVGQREAAAATQILLDAFDRQVIRHDGSEQLRDQLARSTISKRSGGWVLTSPAGSGGVYAARAVMFAVAQATKTPKPRPMIVARRRRSA